MTRADHLTFLRRAIRRPDLLATPFVTGPRLARDIAQVIPQGSSSTVVELGAGTGAMSDPIRARLGPGSRHLAVELDPDLVAHLRRTRPWLELVRGDAREFTRLLDEAGIGTVDVVISSLPWALFPAVQRRALLRDIAARLAPDGAFSMITTWMALPSRVGDLRGALGEVFDEVVETATVWLNPPPARLFVCRRPLVRTDGAGTSNNLDE
ncbi:class I SAM-dependent methyltransferase [Pseudonocardia sp. KRD291]|uniref:class I SAM-dependent methyltransferase n=1 Tax=Pseudonocardia sp. KRD291 TaxID=2792007 RepID=UPI001C4A0D2D|nr:methyltransferase domain-containing protein [Pseudonocardia sp. KRD291]MBW0106543.1 methyltransferase domain-containing protein [Pseudonocardia sp. KRD291]